MEQFKIIATCLKATSPLLDFDLAFTGLHVLLHGILPEEFKAAGRTIVI